MLTVDLSVKVELVSYTHALSIKCVKCAFGGEQHDFDGEFEPCELCGPKEYFKIVRADEVG